MPHHVHPGLPTCTSCQKRKPCLLFEVTECSDGEWSDVLARVVICADCAKNPITQQTIVTLLVEESEAT